MVPLRRTSHTGQITGIEGLKHEHDGVTLTGRCSLFLSCHLIMSVVICNGNRILLSSSPGLLGFLIPADYAG